MVQLRVGPTSRKGLHRDACVLDAAHICLMCVSNHHFVPGLLEVVSDLTDVQEIIEELFGEFAGDTCVLFGCCPNFTPKPLSMYQWASKALCCYGCFGILLESLYAHQGYCCFFWGVPPTFYGNCRFLA